MEAVSVEEARGQKEKLEKQEDEEGEWSPELEAKNEMEMEEERAKKEREKQEVRCHRSFAGLRQPGVHHFTSSCSDATVTSQPLMSRDAPRSRRRRNTQHWTAMH